MAALVSETPIVMPSVIFDVHEAAHLCIERSVTHLFATDDMVHRMIEHGCELSQSKRPFPDTEGVCVRSVQYLLV